MPGCFDAGRAVDDHQAVVTFHDGQVGDVVVADLVQVVGDPVQAAPAQQLRLAPQARVHRVRWRGVIGEIVQTGQVEHRRTVRVRHCAIGDSGDQATVGVGEVLPVGKVVVRGGRTVGGRGRGRGALGWNAHNSSIRWVRVIR
jgi:hypothetical protein